MDNEILFSNNPEFGEIRSITVDETPWFVGKDIATALGYKDTADAIKKHTYADDRMGGQNTDPYIYDKLGRKQYPIFINESGVYSLIFGSSLKNKQEFKHWVTSVVLPSIRKHGGYIVGQEDMSQAEFMAKAFQMSQAILAERELRIAEQDRQIEIMTPKAEFFDAVTDSKDAISMDKVAKVLDMGVGRNKLFEFLRNKGILQKDNVPYQKYIDKGWFRTIEQKYVNGDSIRINIKTLVFQKGVDNIRRLLEEK